MRIFEFLRMKKRTFIALSLMLVALFSLETKAQRFEVSPAKINYELEPGQSATRQITIRNKSDKEQSFVLSLGDWALDEKGETIYDAPGTFERSCSNWISISPSFVTLQPNEIKRINVALSVPEGQDQTKWSIIYVRAAKERTSVAAADKSLRMGINITSRIAVQVFQTPLSNTNINATIENLVDFTTESDSVKVFQAEAINLGDRVLRCKMYLMIADMQTAEEYTLDPIEFTLFPEMRKNISLPMSKKLAPGDYSIAAILDYGNQNELEAIQIDLTVEE